MGEWKRLAGFGLAIVGIGLSLVLPWWRIENAFGSIEISLRKVTECSGGTCVSVETGLGMYGTLSTMTLGYGVAAILAILLGGIRPALSGEPHSRPYAVVAGALYAMLAVFTMASLALPEELEAMFSPVKTIWYYAGVFGGLLAMFTPLLATIGSRRKPPPPVLYKRPAPVTEPPILAPTTRTKPRTIDPIAIESASPIRFALDSAEIRDDAIMAFDATGRIRMVRWGDLGGAIARIVTGILFVDLVPRGGPPLRITTATRLSFEIGGGRLGERARDQLRRVVVLAQARQPGFEIEPATLGFIDADEHPPSWSEDELAQYDERYKR